MRRRCRRKRGRSGHSSSCATSSSARSPRLRRRPRPRRRPSPRPPGAAAGPLANPACLWLLVPVLLLVWLELGKRTATVRFSDAAFLRQQQGFSRWLRLVVLALNVVALVLAVVALARPQRGRVFEEIESHGVDIML